MKRTPSAKDQAPLTPAMFHVLLALSDGERHGYAIMQEIAESTNQRVRMGPGTLYGTIKRLLESGMIEESEERPVATEDDERRRYYRLTGVGQAALEAEAARYNEVARLARREGTAPDWPRHPRRNLNMAKTKDSMTVRVSLKAYDLFLAAYPALFRKRFGAEMRQVFRDQCRAAEEARGVLGLIAFWLRVLPDWTNTCIKEQFAELARNGAAFRMVTIGTAGAFAASTLMAYWSPKMYESRAIIEALDPSARHDPYFMTTQFQILKSYHVLTNVIAKNGLDEKLGQQDGRKRLSLDDAYNRLYGMTSVEKVGRTDLIQIQVRSRDPILTSKIANAIAETYRESRLEQYRSTVGVGIDSKGHLEEAGSFDPVKVRDPARTERGSGTRSRTILVLTWGLGLILALLFGVRWRVAQLKEA